jgi:two-component system response regulator FixJ
VTQSDTKTGTVHVVDDDDSLRRSLQWLLESVGLTVETFSSAADFLARYRRGAPGCILLDLRMPGLSGLELHESFAEEGISLPVIFLTGHGDVPAAVRAMKGGAVDFLEKPFRDHELLESIHAALQRDQDEREGRTERESILARRSTLTPREGEVLQLVVNGASNKVIASELGLSLKTVETHRSRVMRKMAAPSLAELVRMAVETESNEPAGD